ncbi:MAG: PorV/PorQ family protein [bacterium]
MFGTFLLLTLVTFDPAAGTTGFDFLKITPTAREAALAGASVARPDGAFAFYYNPAVTGSVNAAQFSYINYAAGIHLGSAAYTQPFNGNKGFGAGIFYLNSGTMKKTNEQGEELGTFGATFSSFNLSGSLRPNPDLSIGASIAGLYGTIDTFFAVGLIGNLGVTYEPPSIPTLKLGFAATRLGTQLKPFGGRDPMPLELILGATWEPNPALNLNLNLNKPIDNRFNVRAGIEGWVSQFLAIRAGYNSLGTDLMTGSGSDPLAGFAVGLGIRYNRYQLDYTFVPMVVLGIVHRISFGFSL